jgi:hypothetical protein
MDVAGGGAWVGADHNYAHTRAGGAFVRLIWEMYYKLGLQKLLALRIVTPCQWGHSDDSD